MGFSLVNSSSKLLVSAKPFCSFMKHLSLKKKTGIAYDLGVKRWWYPFVKNITEIDIFKERLLFDFLCVFLSGAEATTRITLQELCHRHNVKFS